MSPTCRALTPHIFFAGCSIRARPVDCRVLPGLGKIAQETGVTVVPNCLFNALMGIVYTFLPAMSALTMIVFSRKCSSNGDITLVSDLIVFCHISNE